MAIYLQHNGIKKFGLIGYPLTQSLSKKIFTERFRQEPIINYTYELFPLPNIGHLSDLIKAHPDLCGLNVTMPHKVSVMKYLDWVHLDAQKIGSVNCICITKRSIPSENTINSNNLRNSFRLEGFNTDVYGFEASLRPLLQAHHTKALILGDGGAAKAVKFVLQKIGIDYLIVGRKNNMGKNLLFNELNRPRIQEYTIIVNATPLGTWPRVNACPPIPYEYISKQHLLYDLIYNPYMTRFLEKGQEKGASIKNGLEMLYLQAEKSWELWNIERRIDGS